VVTKDICCFLLVSLGRLQNFSKNYNKRRKTFSRRRSNLKSKALLIRLNKISGKQKKINTNKKTTVK